MNRTVILEMIRNALRNLKREGIRTFLTLIGIIIGVGAIVALLSIGAGLNAAVAEQFQMLGANTIIVFPGNPTSSQTSIITLSQSDISHIEGLSGVKEVIDIYAGQAFMEYDGEKKNIMIMAADYKKAKIFDSIGFFDLDEGIRPERNTLDGALLGNDLALTTFKSKVDIRKIFTLNGESFKTVGILKKQQQALGDPQSSNAVVFLSIDGYKRLNPNPSPLQIMVIANSSDDAPVISKKIKDYFDKKYGEKSVYVSTSEQLLETINQVYGLITIVLVGIAAISIIVGGIGIANAMIASVLERTKEIGVMKALGASDNKVLGMFLIEAGFIGGIGGIIGVTLGYGLASLIAFIGQSAGFLLKAIIGPELIIGAIIFSMGIGMISGFLPARKAAKLDPVEALRYE